MQKPFPIRCWLVAALIFTYGLAMSQTSPISFTDRTNLLLTNNYSGVCMSIADMNADGKDDIVRYHIGRSLNIEYQNAPNQDFSHRNEGAIANFSQWSNCIADVDKNGFNDILVGGKYDNVKILYNQDGLDFHSTNLPNSSIFLQGANFIDIDNDGWVDIFACHDEGDNREYRNDGQGQFDFAPNLINTKTTPVSDNSGSYSSVWTDYDNDNDLDLYISKCKQGVSDPTDPRRVNMLLENDGNNNFTEKADIAGLKIGAQSWLADFADIDNDGDMDAFIANHYSDCQLMRNNGNGTYTDITATSGLLPTLSKESQVVSIQSIFRDFNNDGFVDLMFSGSEHFLFYNNGNRTFTPSNPFPGDMIESFALGDLNSDGFVDVYAGYAEIFTQPSSIKDALFMNNGNNNNFVAVQLEGIQSNINGIGAKVQIYGDWGVQVREVRSGEGYGIMNSFTQYFGIGRSNSIERLVITWPSGIEQTIDNPQINQFLKILEKLPCEGQACNDGDDCTTNDTYDAYCDCIGDISDSDNDGVCDRDDICAGYDDNIDSDNDGTPNGCDSCPNLNNNLIGQPCNDNNPCTIGERYDANCNCSGGSFTDSDYDGVCDTEDNCPGYNDNVDSDNDDIPDGCDNCPNLNDNLIGQPCNDNDPCTVGERYDSNCGCSGGSYTDADNDGYCAAEDSNDNDPCIPDSTTGPCESSTGADACELINYTDFEGSNMGVWLDGGNAAEQLTNSNFAASGSVSFAINGNRGKESSLYTQHLSLDKYDAISISFSALPFTMETGDGFVIEIATNGINYSIAKRYTIGNNISNNVRLTGNEILTGYNLTNSTALRFRTLTDELADYVMIDDITLEGCGVQTSSCSAGAPCNDGDNCTTGETYDTNCNCVGGSYEDSDSDGICDEEDNCPDLNNYFIGRPCNDDDPCTSGEKYDNDCGCSGGITIDSDGDGYCAAVDADDTNPCVPDANNPACGSNNSSDCVLRNRTDFENDYMGIWIDGGGEAMLVTGAAYSNSGNSSFYVRGNGGTQSSLVSESLDLSAVNSAILNFSLLPFSVESEDRLAIEISTNGNYVSYKTLVTGQDLTNNVRKEVEITFENLNFSSNTTIRLRSIGNSSNDYFIFDDVSLELCGSGVTATCTPGTSCNDGDSCTTGETFDSNCNCTGGTFQDSDFDGVCDSQDACPSLNDNLIGTPCDDGKACTIGERYDSNCNCTGGVYTDNDADGYCVGNDSDDNDPCIPNPNSPNCDLDVSDCEILNSTDFENSDMGIWQDGGSSASIVTRSSFANSGIASFYLHNNDGPASSLYTTPQDYSDYKALNIYFFFYAFSVQSGDRFFIEIDNGDGNYRLLKSMRTGIEFQPGDRISASLYVDNINFSNRVSIRFRSATDEVNDYFIFDDISIEGCTVPLSCTPGSACNDNNVCTVGERYDSYCNCTGGVITDNDGDDFCDVLDADDNDPCVPDDSSAACSTNSNLDCNIISRVGFENNILGIWNDGGGYSSILINSETANTGSSSYYIHGDRGGQSSLYTDNLDLSGYSAIRFSFHFTSLGIEVGDKFHVEISTEGTYNTYRTYTAGNQFLPGEKKAVVLDIVGITLSDRTAIRFRSASMDNHYLLFDDITIESCIESLQDENLDSRNRLSFTSEEIKIFPNPTLGLIYVEVPDYQENGAPALLDIYNLAGKKVYSTILTSGQQELNLTTLESNQLYLFRIISNDTEVSTYKIFKQ